MKTSLTFEMLQSETGEVFFTTVTNRIIKLTD